MTRRRRASAEPAQLPVVPLPTVWSMQALAELVGVPRRLVKG